MNYSGSQAKAEEVVAMIQENGGEAIAVQASVSQTEEVTALMDLAAENIRLP